MKTDTVKNVITNDWRL